MEFLLVVYLSAQHERGLQTLGSFPTEEACRCAGDIWLAEQATRYPYPFSGVSAAASCQKKQAIPVG